MAVRLVKPVPPLATLSVPAKVTAPVVPVLGVKPVVPALNDVTPPVDAAQVAVVPLEVNTYELAPIGRRVELFVPLPIIRSPVVVTGDRALKPAAAVVWPVPPLAMATVPVTLLAVPVVFWLSVGTSAAWMAAITTFVPLPRKYEPLVTAPAKAFMAVCAVVWPEPPLAIATVPVTLLAVPVVFWLSVGMSAATTARNVGAPDEPLGAAKK